MFHDPFFQFSLGEQLKSLQDSQTNACFSLTKRYYLNAVKFCQAKNMIGEKLRPRKIVFIKYKMRESCS